MMPPMNDREFAVWLKVIEVSLPVIIANRSAATSVDIAETVANLANTILARYRKDNRCPPQK